MRPFIVAVAAVLLISSGVASPNPCEAQLLPKIFKSKPKPTIHRSPKGSFSLKLPVSAHEIKMSETQDELQEQVTVNDKMGMQLSVLVTHRIPESRNWLQEWYEELPTEIRDEATGRPAKITKRMLSFRDGIPMVYLIKGPFRTSEGQVYFVNNGIFEYQGKIYDISATNPLAGKPQVVGNPQGIDAEEVAARFLAVECFGTLKTHLVLND